MAYEALLRLYEITGEGVYVIETKNHKPVSPRNMDRMLRSCCGAVGFPPARIFGMHALRHTFASMLFAVGEDVKIVSALLGHSDITVIYNTYIHLIEKQQEMVDRKIQTF